MARAQGAAAVLGRGLNMQVARPGRLRPFIGPDIPLCLTALLTLSTYPKP